MLLEIHNVCRSHSRLIGTKPRTIGNFHKRILYKNKNNLLFLAFKLTWRKCNLFLTKIHDGSSLVLEKSNKLTIKTQVVLEMSRKDLPPSVYTTSQSALIRIDHEKLLSAAKSLPTDYFQLRIAKVYKWFV